MMITSFEIENFRCFEKTKLNDLAQVNLIGGKNNAGKTALLEALYLHHAPTVESINSLRRFKGENLAVVKELPGKAWDNFFFNPKRGVRFGLISERESGLISTVQLKIDDNIKSFTKDEAQNSGDILEPRVFDSRGKNVESILTVYQSAPHEDASLLDSRYAFLFNLRANSEEIRVREEIRPTIKQITFIPAGFKPSGAVLAQEYDKAVLNNRAELVLEAIQVIDPSIVQIKTLTIGGPGLYLKRENQGFLPLSLFGEALNRVTDLIVRLINGGGTLLIDEIENGIHYTNQSELWRMLFKLAVEFDTQLFATTHSWEMIRAFRDVGLEEGNETVGAYFELAQNVRTQRITAIKHDLETLDYAVERGMRIRGEQRFSR